MNIFKTVFRKFKKSYGIFIYLLIFVFSLLSFTTSNVEKNEIKYTSYIKKENYGTIVILANNNDEKIKTSDHFRQLKEYLKNFYEIKENINDLDYAMNVGYIDAKIIIPESLKDNEIEVIYSTIKNTLPLSSNINQFINAYENNNLNMLYARVDVNYLVKDKKQKIENFFTLLIFVGFAIPGLLVMSLVNDFIQPKILNKVKMSKISIFKFLLEITTALIMVLALIIIFILLLASYRLQIPIIEFIPYIINTSAFFIITLIINLFVLILTNNTNIVMLFSSGIGSLISMCSLFPEEMLPDIVKNILKFSPSYYFLELNKEYKLEYVIIQFLFFIIFILASIFVIKFRKNK